MKKFFTIFFILISLSVITPTRQARAEQLIGMEISQGYYVSGAIVGTLFGFGTGHLIQGQTVKGLTYMSAQLATLAIGAFGWAQLAESGRAEMLFVGATLFGGIRIFEMNDLWNSPQKRDGNYYIPVKELTIRPDVALNKDKNIFIGLTANMNI